MGVPQVVGSGAPLEMSPGMELRVKNQTFQPLASHSARNENEVSIPSDGTAQ